MIEIGDVLSQKSKGSRVSAVLAAGAGAFLAWLVVAHSFAASIAASDPALALRLNPNNPIALMVAALARLDGAGYSDGGAAESPAQRSDRIARDTAAAQDLNAHGILYPIIKPSLGSSQRAEIWSLAEQTLAAAPLNATAYRIMALVAPDEATTETLMRKAVAHSMRETLAVMWMIQTDFIRKRYAQASDECDIVLRTAPDLNEFIVPSMALIAESPGGLSEIERVLRADPPWRWFFSIA